jgi:hypothetical protein
MPMGTRSGRKNIDYAGFALRTSGSLNAINVARSIAAGMAWGKQFPKGRSPYAVSLDMEHRRELRLSSMTPSWEFFPPLLNGTD